MHRACLPTPQDSPARACLVPARVLDGGVEAYGRLDASARRAHDPLTRRVGGGQGGKRGDGSVATNARIMRDDTRAHPSMPRFRIPSDKVAATLLRSKHETRDAACRIQH